MKIKEQAFYLKVQYRSNTSWQGTIHWLDGRKSRRFRSVLELANLINNAKQKRAESASNNKMLNGKWAEKDSAS